MQARKETLDTQVANERSALRKLEDSLHGAQTTAVALQARITDKRSKLDDGRDSQPAEELAAKRQECKSVAAELNNEQKRHAATRAALTKALAATDAAQERLAGLQAELVRV
jgi:chromosome segregation ATPase